MKELDTFETKINLTYGVDDNPSNLKKIIFG